MNYERVVARHGGVEIVEVVSRTYRLQSSESGVLQSGMELDEVIRFFSTNSDVDPPASEPATQAKLPWE